TAPVIDLIVTVVRYFLDAEAVRLEPDMSALVGLVAVHEPPPCPFAFLHAPFPRAFDPGFPIGAVGGRGRNREAGSGEVVLFRPRLYDQAAVCGDGLVLLGRPGVDVGHLEPVIAERNGFRRARDASVVSNRRREPEHPAGALVFENYWRKLVQYVVGIREPRNPRLRDVLDGKRAEPDRIV